MAEGDLQDQKIAGYQSPLGVTQTQVVTLPGFTTQSGFTFDQIDISYQTLGTLSPARDNAILVCHALSGNARVAGLDPETGRPGWWDYHVGPGKAFDTDRFFIICANVLGGCSGSTGPASLRPGLRINTGLRAAACRATLMNAGPSLTSSRCMAITFVCGSSAR